VIVILMKKTAVSLSSFYGLYYRNVNNIKRQTNIKSLECIKRWRLCCSCRNCTYV